MNKKQRICSLALTLTLAAGLAAPAALAADTPDRGVLTYSEMIAPQYEAAGRFSEGLAPVQKNGKWGYIDADNNVVIPFQYDAACVFNEGRAVVSFYEVEAPDEYGYSWAKVRMGSIDHAGNYVPFLMDDYNYETGATEKVPMYSEVETETLRAAPDAYRFHNGLVNVSFSFGEDWLYTPAGSALPMGYYYSHAPMNEGLIPVYSYDGDAGYLDANGDPVKMWYWNDGEKFGPVVTDEWGDTDQSYRYISRGLPFNQGLAPVWQATWNVETQNETYLLGFMDRNFNWVIQPQYTSYFFSGVDTIYQLFGETGLAMMQKDGVYGAIDKTGKTVIPFQYEELWPYNEGLAVYKQGGKCGYLDGNGNVAIPAQFVKASGFERGLAAVYDGTKAYLIDRTGKAVSGGDKLDASTYFIEDEDGGQTVYSPGEYVVIEENGKYGYGHIEYKKPLPEKTEMNGWAYAEVTAAIEEELVPDYLQSLYLNNINREEFCDLVIQAIEETLDQDIEDIVKSHTGKDLYTLVGEYPFSDTINYNVIAAHALGIVNGRGGTSFDPYAPITRQEAAAFLMRAAKVLGMDTSKTENAGFTDADQVGVWFKDAVNFVYQINVMNGTGEGFSPLGNYTREQSYMTIYRLFKAVVDKG